MIAGQENKGTAKFIDGERLEQYFGSLFESSRAPFRPQQPWNRSLSNLAKRLASLLEQTAGTAFFTEAPLAPLDRIPRRFHPLIHRALQEGIITRCGRPVTIGNWPRIPAFTFQASFGTIASGYDLDEETAATKALAELFERYSLGVYDLRNFIKGSWISLRRRGALDPRAFSSFSENQLKKQEYERHRFDEHSEFIWTSCISLHERQAHLVPAQLVYFRYQHRSNEPQIRQGTTNGAAAGNSWEMAVYHAICENIERDALMIHWLNRITPPQLNLAELKGLGNQKINQLLDLYKDHGIRLNLLDITTDIGIPVILALVQDSSVGRPVAFVSARADVDIETAITAALADGLRAGTWPDVTSEKIDSMRRKFPNIENIRDRHVYWGQRELVPEIAFLTAGQFRGIRQREQTQERKNQENELQVLEKALREKGLSVFIADATSPIARDAGLTVLMSIIPGLYPLYLNEHFKYLGIRRLYEAPVAMNVLRKPKQEDEMNSIPHPML